MGGGMIAVTFVFILFLPSLLSSALFLEKALVHVNKHGLGSIAVRDCSIGWFQGFACHDVEYENVGHGLTLNVKQISSDRGFLALVAAPKNPGVIHVYQPVFELTEQPDRSRLPAEQDKTYNERENRTRGEAEEVPFWEKYIVRLVAEDGRFIFRSFESVRAGIPPLMADFSLFANLSSGTVEYGLQWSGGKEGGAMTADGVVNLPARKATFFETIVGRSKVRVEQLQLAPFLTLALPALDIPFGSGLADGVFTVAGTGLEQLDLFGYLNVTEIKLKSGLAGDGYSGFDWLNIRFDGGLSHGDKWFCNELILESVYGKLTAKGKVSSDTGEADLTASLQMLTSQTAGGQVDLQAAGFFTPSRVLIRDIDVNFRDFMFVFADGLKIEQSELFIRSIKPEVEENIPVTIRKLEIAANMEEWLKHGGGLSGYDWQDKLLFAGNLQMGAELHDESILVRGHPLFGALTTATGRIALRVDDFYWPVAGGGYDAMFTAVFDVSRVHFASRGVLTEILTSLGISEQPLELKEDKIFCKGEAGRISCLPVVIAISGSEMTLSGSAGMDQDLDYLLEIPVCEGLFDRGKYRTLGDATIRIPLRGTVSAPVFLTDDRDIFSETLNSESN